jgi:hypothetical protein
MIYFKSPYTTILWNEEIRCVVAESMQKVENLHLKVSYFATLAEAKAWLKMQ